MLGLQQWRSLMENEEVFEAVRAINKLVLEAEKNVGIANKALQEVMPQLQELLDATRKKTTQSSLEDFPTEKSEKSMEDKELTVAKESIAPRLISELFALEDIRKMLEGE